MMLSVDVKIKIDVTVTIATWQCNISNTYSCYEVSGVFTVFVHNFATPDDFQPHSIKQAHSVISCAFYGSKLTIDSEEVCGCCNFIDVITHRWSVITKQWSNPCW